MGTCSDYVDMQWRMLQQNFPKDYVIATGEQHSVREFIELSASVLNLKIIWSGKGVNETGEIFDLNGTTIGKIVVSEKYYRPTEVETLLGDPSLAKKELNWTPKITFEKLVEEMTKHDAIIAETEKK